MDDTNDKDDAPALTLSIDWLAHLAGRYVRLDVGDITEISLKNGSLHGEYFNSGTDEASESEFDLTPVSKRRFRVTPSQFIVFEAPGEDGQASGLGYQVEGSADVVAVFERAQPISPELRAAIPGRYYCADLGVSWELAWEDDNLLVRLPARARRLLYDEPFRHLSGGVFIWAKDRKQAITFQCDKDASAEEPNVVMTFKGINLVTLEFRKRFRSQM